jgi:hypothetical protein
MSAFGGKVSDIGKCLLLTQSGHRLCIAAMVFEPLRCRRLSFGGGIRLLGGAAAWPLVARAQQGERMRRIGVLIPAGAADEPEFKARIAAFLLGLRDLG